MRQPDHCGQPQTWRRLLRLITMTIAGCGLLVAQDPATMPVLDQNSDLTSFWRQTRNCGPNALYVLASAIGHDVDYEELCNAAAPSATGCTLADLGAAADALGIPTRIGKMTAADLRSTGEPLILHFESGGGSGEATGHFVLLTQWHGDYGEVMDGTSGRYRKVESERLLRKWSGYVVAVDHKWDWTLLLWALGGSTLVGATGWLVTRIRRKGLANSGFESAPRAAIGVAVALSCLGSVTLPAQQPTLQAAEGRASRPDTGPRACVVTVTRPNRDYAGAIFGELPDSSDCVDGDRFLAAVLNGREWRVITAERMNGEWVQRDVRWWRDQLIFREGGVRRFSVMDKKTALDGWRESVHLFDNAEFERVGCRCANTVGDLTTSDAPEIEFAGWQLPRKERAAIEPTLRIRQLTAAEADELIKLELCPGDMVGDWRQGHVDGAVRGHLDYAIGGDLDRMLAEFPTSAVADTPGRAWAFALGALLLLALRAIARQRENSRRLRLTEARS